MKRTKHPKWLQEFWKSKGKLDNPLADTPGLYLLSKYTGKSPSKAFVAEKPSCA